MKIIYLLWVSKSEACEDVGASADSKPDERLYAEMPQHIVQLVGQLIHSRVDVAGTNLILYLFLPIYGYLENVSLEEMPASLSIDNNREFYPSHT